MPYFSELSHARLETCHADLQRLFHEVVKTVDCTVIDGHRDEIDQTLAFENKKSMVQWPGSKHNRLPSDAVDVGPWPLDWKDTGKFYYFIGYVVRTAQEMGIPLRVGGDWNGNHDLKDQNFFDLVHFERKEQ